MPKPSSGLSDAEMRRHAATVYRNILKEHEREKRAVEAINKWPRKKPAATE